jgi:predicted permease
MRWRDRLGLRLRGLLFRNQEDRRLRAEMQFHLDALIAENIAAGMSPEEARYAAMRTFGNATLANEQVRETWGWTWLEQLAQDFRYAARQLMRSPGFVLVTVLTLTLGIGANTAIFTLMNALLLKSLPVSEPERLARIVLAFDSGKKESDGAPLNFLMLQSIERRSRSFSGILGWSDYGADLKEGDTKRSYPGAMVSGNTFEVLGVRPAIGRLLTPADDRPGGGPDGWAMVISHPFWVEHYHADPAVVGRQVMVNGHGATIVGVAPANFEGIIVTSRPDFYMPLEYEPVIRQPFGDSMLHRPGILWLTTMARLKTGVTLAQASTEISALSHQVIEDTLPPQARNLPGVQRARFVALPGRSGWSYLREQYTRPLLLIQMLVAAVLLISCANLAGLGLARASARQHEFALRVALGAARTRMLRQMLVESFLLAIPGALLGLGFAWGACGMLMQHFAGDAWSHARTTLATRPDTIVLFGTAACAVLCAVLFGISPAWIASRAAPEPALRSTGNGSTRSEKSRLRQGFVCLEVALSLALVVMAGLLSATLVELHAGGAGIHLENNFFATVDVRPQQQGSVALTHLYWRLAERMQQMPGVQSVSAVGIPPLRGAAGAQFSVTDGSMGTEKQARQNVLFNELSAHFFSELGIPLLAGRDFVNSDADANTCIVSQSAARKFFPNKPALGGSLRQYQMSMDTGGSTTNDCEIIGVVGDAKLMDLRRPAEATVYRPISGDMPNPGLWNFMIQSQSLSDARNAYVKALHELAPGKAEFDLIPFTVQLNESVSIERLLAQLSGFFAGLALLLSGIGIYGLVAWSVTQRTREIGVRMALGATRMRVFALVMRQVLALLAVGVAAGGVAAFFAARSIRSFLFEVQPGSPVVFLMAVLALVLIGVLAALLPARRAVSIDPMRALRTE